MDVKIYDNYGVLAREKQHVYTTAPEATAAVSEPFYIIIPEGMRPYVTASGEVALELPDVLKPYLLREVLATGHDGMPTIRYIDRKKKSHTFYPGTYGA